MEDTVDSMAAAAECTACMETAAAVSADPSRAPPDRLGQPIRRVLEGDRMRWRGFSIKFGLAKLMVGGVKC